MALKTGDFVEFWSAKGHHWGQVIKVNRQSVKISVFHTLTKNGPTTNVFQMVRHPDGINSVLSPDSKMFDARTKETLTIRELLDRNTKVNKDLK